MNITLFKDVKIMENLSNCVKITIFCLKFEILKKFF